MSDNIPSGVMTEILGRLSWCELCRLRCVCKEWRSILDEPSFIQRQLKRSTSLFLRVQKDYRCYVSYGFQPGTFCPDRLEEGWHGRYVYSVMGSCHGLVCLADFENQLRLVNPVFPEEKQSVTLEHLMTRDPLLSTHDVYFDANYFDIDEDYLLSSVEWAGYGFGYDEVARDYKAVILLTAGSEEYHDMKSYILTYSFRTRSFSVCHANRNWNRSAIKNQEMGVLLGGSLHWILEPHVIHSYDLGSDVFGKIQQPKYTAHGVSSSSSSIVKVGVGVVDSCLCVCATYGKGSASMAGGRVDVWVMKEYGNEDSWCILYSVVDKIPVFDQPQFVRSLGMLDGWILMLVDGTGLSWVDPRNGRVEVFPIPGFTNASKFEAVLCLESQVKTFPGEDYETIDDIRY